MEALFVYGTLQDPKIQQRLMGRTLNGEEDRLPGFYKDTELLAPYPVAIPEPTAVISGHVLYVSAQELQTLDSYEGTAYLRIRTQLASGISAWVYCLNMGS